MKLNLGIAPIAWSNDDMPEVGGGTPIEQCLEEASLAGFTGIELGGKFPRNSGIIKFLLQKYKLSLPGGWYGSLLHKRSIEDEWSAMQGHIQLLQHVNASVFVFADVSGSIQGDINSPLSKRPQLENHEWPEYCKKISDISRGLASLLQKGILLKENNMYSIHYRLIAYMRVKADCDYATALHETKIK